MSKNKPFQREVHTRPVAIMPTHTMADITPQSTEQWIVTHDSKSAMRPPHTEIVYGDIREWLKENKDNLFITYANRIK